MKAFISLLLAGSLLANLVFLVAFAGGKSSEPPIPEIASSAPPVGRGPTPLSLDAGTWATLHSEDLPTLVGRLREAGFPPTIVRAVLMAQLEDDYIARRRAAQPNADAMPFWKNVQLDPAAEAAMRQASRDLQKKITELLGPNGAQVDPMTQARESRQLAHLEPEKADHVRQLFREFAELRNDVYMNVSSTIGTADREKLQAIEKRQNEAIAQYLSPAEFEEYELRGSTAANMLRSRLGAFEATEAEFRMMFQLQRGFEQQLAPLTGPMPTSEEQRRRSDAQRQLTDQIKQALGPARAEEFERTSNYEYARTNQLVARLQLPPETTHQLWSLQQDMQRRTTEIRSNREMPAEQRTTELNALAAEANAKLTPLLGGSRGVEAYRQNGGFWLQDLTPPPPRPAAVAPKN